MSQRRIYSDAQMQRALNLYNAGRTHKEVIAESGIKPPLRERLDQFAKRTGQSILPLKPRYVQGVSSRRRVQAPTGGDRHQALSTTERTPRPRTFAPIDEALARRLLRTMSVTAVAAQLRAPYAQLAALLPDRGVQVQKKVQTTTGRPDYVRPSHAMAFS